MNNARRISILLVAAAFAATGCPSNTQVQLPVPGSMSNRLYVSSDATPFGVTFFPFPINSSSTASGSFSVAGEVRDICSDSQNRLFVPLSFNSAIAAYAQPIGSGATSSFSLSTNGAPVDCAFDSNGNLYVADSGASEVDVFKAPVTSSSTIDHSITASVSIPFGVSVDPSGNVYVANTLSGGITQYSPFGSGNTLLHQWGGTIADNFGIEFGPDNNLYVANGAAEGEIDVYKGPTFTNSSTVDHTITPPSATLIFYIKFDASGKMYVGGHETGPTSVVWVFAPPYTGAPIATVTVAAGVGHAEGIAITQ